MLIVMESGAKSAEIKKVLAQIKKMGLKAEPIPGSTRTAIGVLGNKGYVDADTLVHLPGVKELIHVSKPYKLVSREWKPENTVVKVDRVEIGGGKPVVMAGPCSVESEEQIIETAKAIKKAGANMLRGGAFKPRTTPYSFRGLGEEGLKFLQKAKKLTGLPIVTEVLHIRNLNLVAKYADVIQIGARNMQNFDLLTEVGKLNKPVLLKRGMSATVEEFLLAAEYILNEGNQQVILCERGIRTFETATRNTLDLNAVALIKEISHLPIIVDPSHGTGKYSLVPALAKASLSVGADGLMVEVHPEPTQAFTDGDQSLSTENFGKLMRDLKSLKLI